MTGSVCTLDEETVGIEAGLVSRPRLRGSCQHDACGGGRNCSELATLEMELPLNTPSLIAGAVIAREGEALLIRRAVPERGLLWQFPAGKVDPGETVPKAAARESLEEAGVAIEPLSVIGERVHPATGRRVVYVACRWLSGEARPASPREVAAVAWVPFAELDGYIPHGVYEPVRTYLMGPALPL